MARKSGLCQVAVVESLAAAAGEEGADEPSDDALSLAMDWERDPVRMCEFIRGSGRWCQRPTGGCFSARCPHVFGPKSGMTKGANG